MISYRNNRMVFFLYILSTCSATESDSVYVLVSDANAVNIMNQYSIIFHVVYIFVCLL